MVERSMRGEGAIPMAAVAVSVVAVLPPPPPNGLQVRCQRRGAGAAHDRGDSSDWGVAPDLPQRVLVDASGGHAVQGRALRSLRSLGFPSCKY